MQSKFPLALMASAALLLGGCFGELDDDEKNVVANNDPAASNSAPTIAGSPPPRILEGQVYEFSPTATDADGDTLEFTISRKPAWATFDRATGRLSGTPGASDVGSFTNIGVSVSDGKESATLASFHITVDQIAIGSATLSWNPPTENSDGSAMTDLAGYRIYYGRNPDLPDHSVVLNNPGLTRHVVENLTPANWHFSMTSVNQSGVESRRSTPVSKSIT